MKAYKQYHTELQSRLNRCETVKQLRQELLLLEGCFILDQAAKKSSAQRTSTRTKAWRRCSQRSRIVLWAVCHSRSMFRWETELWHQAAVLRVRKKNSKSRPLSTCGRLRQQWEPWAKQWTPLLLPGDHRQKGVTKPWALTRGFRYGQQNLSWAEPFRQQLGLGAG